MDRSTKPAGAGEWVLWAVLALIVSGLLADVAFYAHRTSIEDDLTTRSEAALRAAGLPGLQVAFHGRDGTVRGTGAEVGDGARAAYVLRTVEGVRVADVSVRDPGSAPAGPVPLGPALPGTDKQVLQAQINGLVAAGPITFGPDSAQLVPQAIATVDRVAVLLSGAPDVAVEVAGYAAKTPGTPQRAQQLSQQRADVVAQRLIAQRVTAGRVHPIGRSDTPALPDLAASRRVEIIVR